MVLIQRKLIVTMKVVVALMMSDDDKSWVTSCRRRDKNKILGGGSFGFSYRVSIVSVVIVNGHAFCPRQPALCLYLCQSLSCSCQSF